MAARALDVDGLVCDLDGVVYRGSRPIEGASEAIARLVASGTRIVFCTNNSSPRIVHYRDKLSKMGVQVEEDQIVTSATVAGEVLAGRDLSGADAIVVGGEGIREALSRVGVNVVDDPTVLQADVVVVGRDESFDYAAMHRAAHAVRAGALFMATNDDSTYPAEETLWPGGGAILASIEVASDRRAEVVGKPHRPMLEMVAGRFDPGARLAIVGDRDETDLAGGRAMGWKTVLVLSGVTDAEHASALDPQPDRIVGSLVELVDQ